MLLLGDVRGGLLVASVIPLAFGATLIVMRALGVSGNLMSLGALDFGLIIDGAIVVVENITRQLSITGARGDRAVRREVRRATATVVRPVIFGTAIIMIVYVPILSLQGTEGKMFRPMAIAVIAALAAALMLAIAAVPAAASWLYRGGVSEREPWLARMAGRAYAPVLAATLRHRAWVMGACVVVVAAGAWVASTLGAEFVPTLDEGAIAMQAVRPPSVSLEESVAATGRIERALKDEFPKEIKTIVSRTGRAEVATDPMGVEISDLYIALHPIEAWERAGDKAALVEQMEEALSRLVPGQNYAFSQPIELRTNELISGVRADVAINVYGPEFEGLEQATARIEQVVGAMEGAADVSADQVAGLPSLRVIVDRREAARRGLDAEDALDAVSAIGGRPVGTVLEGEQRIAMQVRLVPEARASAASIRSLLLTTPDGRRVPLGQIAHVIEDVGPAVVSRERAQRRATVQVNVRGRDLTGFVHEAQARVREADLPDGYFVEWGGQFEHLEAASARLMVAVPLSLLLIFCFLYANFGAVRPALIIYLNVPMAAVGGVVALWWRGMPLSISAAVGFIALSGIAVLNGVVMISLVRDLQREGVGRREATERGATLRLRAVLMTALTDGLGFLPMALSTSAGAEVQRPLATVVVGGLVSATLLTLCVIPAVYSVFGGDVDGEDEGAS